MDNDNELLKERFINLPAEIQDAILAPENQELPIAIGKRYRLQPNEVELIQKEMLLVLLGLNDPLDFPTNIERTTALGKNDAYSIAQEINEKVFSPLRDAFHMVYKQDQEDAEIEAMIQEQEAADVVDPTALEERELGAIERDLPEQVFNTAPVVRPEQGVELAEEAATEEPGAGPQSLVDAKLSPGTDPLTTQETVLEEDVPLHEKIQLPEQKRHNLYKGNDPYREQIDPPPNPQ